MNREGFARKASWRRFPVLGCKGGWVREGVGTHSGEVPQGPLRLTKVPFPPHSPTPESPAREGVACQEPQSLPGSEEETPATHLVS